MDLLSNQEAHLLATHSGSLSPCPSFLEQLPSSDLAVPSMSSREAEFAVRPGSVGPSLLTFSRLPSISSSCSTVYVAKIPEVPVHQGLADFRSHDVRELQLEHRLQAPGITHGRQLYEGLYRKGRAFVQVMTLGSVADSPEPFSPRPSVTHLSVPSPLLDMRTTLRRATTIPEHTASAPSLTTLSAHSSATSMPRSALRMSPSRNPALSPLGPRLAVRPDLPARPAVMAGRSAMELAAIIHHPRIVQVLAMFPHVVSLEYPESKPPPLSVENSELSRNNSAASLSLSATGHLPHWQLQVEVLPVLMPAAEFQASCSTVLPCLGMQAVRSFVTVLEWCDSGSLAEALKKGQLGGEAGAPGSSALSSLLPLQRTLLTLHDIARAVCCLHRLQLQHSHLQPGHIMLQSAPLDVRGYVAKLSGLHHLHDMRCMQPLHGPTSAPPSARLDPHRAPECVKDGFQPVGGAADVYALGVMMWELYVGKLLELDPSKPRQALAPSNDCAGLLQFPPGTPSPLVALTWRCCMHDPWERPNMEQVLSSLNLMMVKYSLQANSASMVERKRTTSQSPLRLASGPVAEEEQCP